MPATTPAPFPDIFPRFPFNSFPLRVSRHPHIQSWIMIPLSRPQPRLAYSSPPPSPFFSRSQVHLSSDFRCLDPASQNVTNHIISDLKIYPSLSWISPHFLSHIRLTSTHFTSPPPVPHGRRTRYSMLPYAYRRLPPVPRASFLPFHGTISILPAPALTSPTTSEFVQLHMLSPSPSRVPPVPRGTFTCHR